MSESVLLVSVGGSPKPIAYCINHYQPAKVVFFASKGSRGQIEKEIRPLLTHVWEDAEIITTPDAQDMTKCMETLVEQLPGKLEVLDFKFDELLVDYTGGTKTMSAAVVLATIDKQVRYSYVGGQDRNKEGLGTVLDGSEVVVINPNPWDVLALELKRRMGRQFNQARFAEARQTAGFALHKVTSQHKPLYKAFRDLFEGYFRWSVFDYGRAVGPLRKGLAKLEEIAPMSGDKGLMGFTAALDEDARRLELIKGAFQQAQKKGAPVEAEAARALIVDLVGNGVRAVRLGSRSDDGVARLYSAIEKLAKLALMERGIDNSGAKAEQLPATLREGYVQRFQDPESGLLRFGLDASYRLLDALGDPLGKKYMEREKDLSAVLGIRNSSLMVHGWTPVKEDTFDKMLLITLAFIEMTEEQLPKLPALVFERG